MLCGGKQHFVLHGKTEGLVDARLSFSVHNASSVNGATDEPQRATWEHGSPSGTQRETTCYRQYLVMSSKLALHDHRNLVCYPLICCHSFFQPDTIHAITQSTLFSYQSCANAKETLLHKHSKNTAIIFFLPIIPVREVWLFFFWIIHLCLQDKGEGGVDHSTRNS